MLGVVGVDDTGALEDLAAFTLPALFEVAEEYARRNDHTDIVIHRRELGWLVVADGSVLHACKGVHVDLRKDDIALLVDLSGNDRMNDTDRTDLLAVKQDGVEVDRVLVAVSRLGGLIVKRQVLEVVGDHREHIAQLEIEVADLGGLAVEGDGELFVLNAEVIAVHTVYHSADLKDTELRRVADVGLDLTKLGGDHGSADGLDIRVGRVGEFDILLDRDAERLLLVGISPDVGMNLVQIIALDKDILDLVLVALDNVLANRIER